MTQFIVLSICNPKGSESLTRGLHSKISFKFKAYLKKKNRVLLALGVEWVERNDEMINI